MSQGSGKEMTSKAPCPSSLSLPLLPSGSLQECISVRPHGLECLTLQWSRGKSPFQPYSESGPVPKLYITRIRVLAHLNFLKDLKPSCSLKVGAIQI